MSETYLGDMTSVEVAALVSGDRPLAILVPVGSVEPHGPHMALQTDTVLSIAAARRAIPLLTAAGVDARIAPPLAYGVTECAAAFPGAISIPAAVLVDFLRAIVSGYLNMGAEHVCLVNNHLEPAHDRAIRTAAGQFDSERVSVACPLTRRWGKTLSAEYKSGACHAGRYETSMIMAENPALVREQVRAALPEVPISLAEKLRAGVTDFAEMGLDRAYAGAPAAADAEHGEDLLGRLAVMIATEVREALGRASDP